MTEVQRARKLGEAAFWACKMCVPALDAEVMPMMKGKQPGQSIDILNAWLKGWTIANLNSDTGAPDER